MRSRLLTSIVHFQVHFRNPLAYRRAETVPLARFRSQMAATHVFLVMQANSLHFLDLPSVSTAPPVSPDVVLLCIHSAVGTASHQKQM